MPKYLHEASTISCDFIIWNAWL